MLSSKISLENWTLWKRNQQKYKHRYENSDAPTIQGTPRTANNHQKLGGTFYDKPSKSKMHFMCKAHLNSTTNSFFPNYTRHTSVTQWPHIAMDYHRMYQIGQLHITKNQSKAKVHAETGTAFTDIFLNKKKSESKEDMLRIPFIYLKKRQSWLTVL